MSSEAEALVGVESAGREAITELRRLLGMLRDESHLLPGGAPTAPQPTLAELGRLVEESRAHGLAVRLDVAGRPRTLEPTVEISAYRIVQEALTNVRKHAQAGAVSIKVCYDEDRLRLQVADDGVGVAGPRAGFGLAGIRERVEIFGGMLSTSSPPGGGFAIDATLPLADAR
jgi:signal transduction histidine kinase